MKLTTKLLLIFLGVGLLVYAGLVFYAVPMVRSYLVAREYDIARVNLQMVANDVRSWLEEARNHPPAPATADDTPDSPDAAPATTPATAPGPESARLGDSESKEDAATYARLRSLFTQFIFHQTGRLFLIDDMGRFLVAPDASSAQRTVSTTFLYSTGERSALMAKIRQNRGGAIAEYPVYYQHVPSTVFVLPLGHRFVCLAVDDEELHGTADFVARVLLVLLTGAVGIYFVVFFGLFRRIKGRLDAIVANAKLVADGNFNLQVADPAADEIGTLGRVIDRLAASLRERQAFAEQLRRAQKLELVGAVASGVAHDFNNILGGMRTAVDLCLQEVREPANGSTPDQELLASTLQLAAECALRGRDSVERMVAFARRSEGVRTFLDLNAVINDLGQICSHSFDKRVKVTLHPLAGQAVVKGDRGQLEQAILNLCINARDAMQGGRGEITLQVERLAQTAGLAPLRQEGPHFRLTVQDNGAGMDPDTVARMFEPFFTTKEGGSGLGMAMTFKIIAEHHGWIDVQSQLDVGTRCHLYLPQAATSLPDDAPDSTELGSAATPPAELAAAAKGTRVLLIEDDPVVLHQGLRALERGGCVVQTAPGAGEARRILAAHPDSYDLVICDPLLPHLGDPDAIASIRAQQPRARLLLLGRSSRDPRIAEWLAQGCHGFLGKPWSDDDLLQAVRAAMAAT